MMANNSTEEMIVQEQNIRNRTKIRGSNIDPETAGQDGQGDRPKQGVRQRRKMKQNPFCSLPITAKEIEYVASTEKIAQFSNRQHVRSFTNKDTFCDFEPDVWKFEKFRQEDKGTEENDEIQLSDIVWMFRNKKISEHAGIYLGELRSKICGKRIIVIKLVQNDKYSRAEAKILAKLSENPHTNILPLIHSDICQYGHEEYLYIAMEKCHNENLGQFVMNRRNECCPFDYNFLIALAQQVISGVEFIHSKNIIHKDLKPDNILFSMDQTVIRIADFGISEEIQSSSARVFKKHQFGTNGYRPSESYGDGVISLKTDIFSLGAVLHFLLSNGEHPFGNIPELWSYNVKKDLGMDLSGLLVPNAKTTSHLVRCMLSFKRCNRPTIQDVLSHPCWTGNEAECDFHYECEETEFDHPQTGSTKQPCIIPPDTITQWQKYFEEKDKFDRAQQQADISQQAAPVATNVAGSLLDAVQSSEFKAEAATGERSFKSTNDQDSHQDETEEHVTDDIKHRNLSKTSEGFFSSLRKVFQKTKGKDSRAKAGSEKTGQAMSDEERKKKIALLSERISALLKKPRHLEALKLLEELALLQSTRKLDTSLQMADCFLHLGKKIEAREAIGTVRHIIVTSHTLSADGIFTLGCTLHEKSSHVQAIILLRIASDLFKTNASSPDDEANGIYKCIIKTDVATRPLIKAGGRSLVIGLEFGVVYMEEMFENLRSVKNAEPGDKTLKQATCLRAIGLNYDLANEHEKRLKSQQTGIEMLERQFGSDASKYRLYSFLLNNTGNAFRNLGKFSDAEKYYLKSIDEKQKATDFADESERQYSIEITKSNLEYVRAKLGKM